MATKYLLRSVMEGGHSSFGKWKARERTRRERSRMRTILRAVTGAPAVWDDDGVLMPFREPVDARGTLRMCVVIRWLLAQSGKPWGEVYSRLKRRLRRTPYILEDALRHVVHSPELRNGYRTCLLVGEDGTIRACITPTPEKEPKTGATRAKIISWLAGRKVIERGKFYFWGELAIWRLGVSGYRQGKRFSEDDVLFFSKLPESTRADIISGTFHLES